MSPSSRTDRAWFALVSALAIALHVALALVNRESNDAHMDVVSLILLGRWPAPNECWECFQPRFWYAICALVLHALDLTDASARIVAAQLTNVAAGTALLVLFARFLHHLTARRDVAFATFALLALNPDLGTIQAQASNDTWSILFASTAFYALWRHGHTRALRHAFVLVTASLLAAVTKGPGLAVLAIVCAVLGLRLLDARRRNQPVSPHAWTLAVLVFVSVPLVPTLGNYLLVARYFGSPLAMNVPPDPLPDFCTETLVNRPGVTSFVHAYGTFRFGSLLAFPYDTQFNDGYPAHRTSLWSQLYGRYFFAHFAQWPASWADLSPAVLWLGRAVFVLALVPTALFVRGLWQLARTTIRSLVNEHARAPFDEGLAVFFLAVFLVAMVRTTAYHRCFCVMKTVYLMPALLPATWAFVRGAERFSTWIDAVAVRRRIAEGGLALLLALHVTDQLMLIAKLAYIRATP